MQYTPHYNLNLPEGSDIVNPLVQDNPNYSAIDTAMYDNKLRVVGTATHVKTGTNHAITLADSDINQFKFVATGDYAVGDTFTVDGVTVTPRIADGSTIPNGAFKINSTVLCILDGTVLNLLNVSGNPTASDVPYNNTSSGLTADDTQEAIDEVVAGSIKALALSYNNFVWDDGNKRFRCSKTNSTDLLPAGATILGVFVTADGAVLMSGGLGSADYARVLVTGYNVRDGVSIDGNNTFRAYILYI